MDDNKLFTPEECGTKLIINGVYIAEEVNVQGTVVVSSSVTVVSVEGTGDKRQRLKNGGE